jgi:hypothetical protein
MLSTLLTYLDLLSFTWDMGPVIQAVWKQLNAHKTVYVEPQAQLDFAAILPDFMRNARQT